MRSLQTLRHPEPVGPGPDRALNEPGWLAGCLADPVVLVAGGSITWVSPAIEDVTGQPSQGWIGLPYEALGVAADRRQLSSFAARVAAGTAQRHRYRLPARAGGCHWVEGHAIPIADLGRRAFAETLRVIDDTVATEERLRRLANLDPLTGLPNRGEALARVADACTRVQRHGGAHALLFCDVDGLKRVNDELGHAGGDALLLHVARQLQRSVRSSDLVARIGGDEFIVLLQGLGSVREGRELARSLRDAASVPVLIQGRLVQVSLSVGRAMIHPGATAAGLLARADAEMYAEKRSRASVTQSACPPVAFTP